MPELAKRALLTDFLKTRRARLHPADVGLADDPDRRRRVPGLRRSEVAKLAGISTDWYTLFETGRDRAMTPRLLERISAALRFNEVERDYLCDLVRAEPPPAPAAQPHPGIEHWVASTRDACIAVYDRWATPILWNAVAEAILCVEDDEWVRTNALWRVFQLPQLRAVYHEWEQIARFAVGLFRRGLARDPGNAVARRIFTAVRDAPDFSRFWREHHVASCDTVATSETAILHIRHPRLGVAATHETGFEVPGSKGARILLLSPATANDGALLTTAGADLIAQNGGRAVYRSRGYTDMVLSVSEDPDLRSAG